MKITTRDSDWGTKDIYIEKDNKKLSIFFGGNGDLYWVINSCEKKEETKYESFTITKENYRLYELFEILYKDIEEINIFKDKELPYYIETEEDYNYYLHEQEEEKEMYRTFNHANYNNLFDRDNKRIIWYSDETNHKVSNIVIINKLEDTFFIEFLTQPYIQGYEREDNILGTIGVRFRNSGSSYDPFNIVFMNMFKELQSIDDVNDIGHQIHIEEYLYNNKKSTIKKLKLTK